MSLDQLDTLAWSKLPQRTQVPLVLAWGCLVVPVKVLQGVVVSAQLMLGDIHLPGRCLYLIASSVCIRLCAFITVRLAIGTTSDRHRWFQLPKWPEK